MLIHKFETYALLTEAEYHDICERVKKDKNWSLGDDGLYYFGTKLDGILISFSRIKKSKFKGYRLKYKIRPRRVMEPNNYIGLFDSADYKKLVKKLDKSLSKICSELPKINDCSILRIDFCINAHFKNHEQVKAYINLAKRCRMPKSLEHFSEYYDKNTKTKKKCNDGMTVISENYMAVSIFSRLVSGKGKSEFLPIKQFDAAQNILCVEIRCMEDKIKHLRKKFGVSSISEYMKYADEIGNYLYNYYLPKMFCGGDFHTLPEAEKKIRSSELDEETKGVMIDLLREANASGSLDEACKLFTNSYGKKYVKKLLAKFDQLETSPLTVTKDIQKAFKNGKIPHPIELFKDWRNYAG